MIPATIPCHILGAVHDCRVLRVRPMLNGELEYMVETPTGKIAYMYFSE